MCLKISGLQLQPNLPGDDGSMDLPVPNAVVCDTLARVIWLDHYESERPV